MRLVFLLAFVLAVPAAYAQLQIHAAIAPTMEGDTAGMTRQPVVTLPGREVWVGDVVLDLPPASIQTVGLETDANGGTALSLWLSGEARQAFAELTARSVGKALAVIYAGRVLTAPVVMAPVSNGLVTITGLDPEEAERLADAIRKANEPPEVLEPDPQPEPRPPQSTTGMALPRSPTSESPSAPASTASQTAQRYADAISARDWRAASAMLHPESVRAARARALSILELDEGGRVEVQSEGLRGSFAAADALGFSPSGAISGLSDRDLATLYLAALDALGAWGSPSASREVIGEVRDGDRLHIVFQTGGADAGVSDVSVVTLVRDAADWRPLLTRSLGF